MRSLKSCHPLAQAVYFLSLLLCAMFCSNPVMQIISLAGGALFFLTVSRSVKVHLCMLGLFTVMALLNPLFSHRGATVLFVMNDSPVTLEAFFYGIFSACAAVSVLYWFMCFSRIMTTDRLLYVFGFLSPKLALVLSMALRYVPLLTGFAKKINASQKALGLYREANAIDSIRGGTRVFSALATWALENGIITADSMAGRGYGVGKRSFFSNYRFRAADLAVTAVSLALGAAVFWGICAGKVSFAFYPTISPPDISSAALFYVLFAVLSFLPFFLEVGESIKWNCLKSKI